MKTRHRWLIIKRLKPEFWVLLLAAILVCCGLCRVRSVVSKQIKAQKQPKESVSVEITGITGHKVGKPDKSLEWLKSINSGNIDGFIDREK